MFSQHKQARLDFSAESWCNSDISDAYLNIDGYELQQDLRMDRSDTAQGRGSIGIYKEWCKDFKTRPGIRIPSVLQTSIK